MDGYEYIQYLTEKSFSYLQLTKEERRERKNEQARRKAHIPSHQNHWFGVIPFLFKFLIRKR